jgi:hypothetical protein
VWEEDSGPPPAPSQAEKDTIEACRSARAPLTNRAADCPHVCLQAAKAVAARKRSTIRLVFELFMG